MKDNCKPDIKILLLGNKSDLKDKRQVNSDDGADFALKNNFIFLETSCLKNTNVADGFETLIELTYREKMEKNKDDKEGENIKINNSKNEEGSRCFC